MVCRAKVIGVLLLMSICLFAGCSNSREKVEDNKEENKEEKIVGDLNVAGEISKLLECDKRTAESLAEECYLAGMKRIISIQKEPSKVYSVLKMTTEEPEDYYVFFTRKLLLQQVRKGARDGERIYMVME